VVHVDGIKQEIMSLGLAGKYTTLEWKFTAAVHI
jgi:hypothetical protein